MINFVPLSYEKDNPWANDLWLLTPEEFEMVPEGYELTSIFYEKIVKGTDYIDMDTRFGYLAFGVYGKEFFTKE